MTFVARNNYSLLTASLLRNAAHPADLFARLVAELRVLLVGNHFQAAHECYAQDGLRSGHFIERVGNIAVTFLDVLPDRAISFVIAHRLVGRDRGDLVEDASAESVERQRLERAQLLPVGLKISRNMSLAFGRSSKPNSSRRGSFKLRRY